MRKLVRHPASFEILTFIHFALLFVYSTYMNSTAVTEEVNRIKSRPNLLTWYTGDEPDGTSDPLNATLIASNLIQSLDGGDGKGGAGYHPVTLVLNCENYFFTYVVCFVSRKAYLPSLFQRVHQRRRHRDARYVHDRQQCHLLDTVGDSMYGGLRRLRVGQTMNQQCSLL